MIGKRLAGLLMVCISVRCWHPTGHFLTALIAKKEIEKADADLIPYLESVLKLLGLYTKEASYPFIESAEFPDDIKFLNWKSFDSWHFNDIYIYMPDAPNKNLPQNPQNVVWAINESHETLSNQKTSEVNIFFGKSFMLRYLIHLVGDIHQPLHNTSLVSSVFPDGDAGGNNFAIDYHSVHDLHTLWDVCLKQYEEVRAPLTDANMQYLDDAATAIMTEFTRDALKDKLADVSPTGWSNESQQIAQDFVYAKINVNDTPTDEYITDGFVIVKQQLALGGYRLADLLLKIFTPDNRKPVSFQVEKRPAEAAENGRANKIQVETD